MMRPCRTRMFYQVLLIIVLSIVYLPQSSCECRETYVTICDTFEDVQKFKNKENVVDLVIGVESNGKKSLKTGFLMEVIDLNKFSQLISLTLLGVYKAATFRSYTIDYTNSTLKYVKFYGNDMAQIKRDLFPQFSLNRLSLINNNIEIIKPRSFIKYQIDEFDASDNLIELIAKDTFHEATRKIIFNNNRIVHVETGSLPANLKTLRLKKNRLRNLQDGVIDAMKNLEELDLGYNKFDVIPNVGRLLKLIIFDISYNEITYISGTKFNNMDNLKYLDFSGNRLRSLDMSFYILPNQPRLIINLAMNHIAELDFANLSLKRQILVSYGNPLACKDYDKLKKQLTKHEDYCETQFLSNGQVPSCFDFKKEELNYGNEYYQDDVARFQNIVKKHIDPFWCKLSPDRYHLISNVTGKWIPPEF